MKGVLTIHKNDLEPRFNIVKDILIANYIHKVPKINEDFTILDQYAHVEYLVHQAFAEYLYFKLTNRQDPPTEYIVVEYLQGKNINPEKFPMVVQAVAEHFDAVTKAIRGYLNVLIHRLSTGVEVLEEIKLAPTIRYDLYALEVETSIPEFQEEEYTGIL